MLPHPLAACLQVTIVPAAPVLRANTTTDIEVRYRPLLVAPAEGVLKLECPELGSYEWQLRLSGTATNPERTLGFSVPLGNRETQVRASVQLGARI